MSLDSEIAGGEESVEASKMFVKKMTALTAKRSVYSYILPPGLVPVLEFLVHIMHFLGNLNRGVTMFEKSRYILLLQ